MTHAALSLMLIWWPGVALPERVNVDGPLSFCQDAVPAIALRAIAPDGSGARPVKIECLNRSEFKPGWDCIKGFNCPKGK